MYRPDLQWILHLRADSSPQFSRDFFVAECDYVNLENVYSLKPTTTLSSLTWQTRVLPVQVLGRKATSTSYKFRSLIRMLFLETGDCEMARFRTASFLNDMGVEARLSLLPDLSSDVNRRAFPNTLPLHDLDHAFHHMMEEIRSCWEAAIFNEFDKQLNTLAKYFSKSDNCVRFKKHYIIDNPKVEPFAKKTICKMFDRSCPSLVKHRWEYRFEVLTWLTQRSAFLSWLDPSSIGRSDSEADGFGDPDYVFSDAELKCLDLLFTSKSVSACFWSLANSMLLLCKWGHDVSGWMHGCHCHPTKEAACLQFR